jgi:Zn-finger nucleic acid-binding protein
MAPAPQPPTGPACPRCGNALFQGTVGRIHAFGCGACGGVWLDNTTSTTILRRFDDDASTLAAMVDGTAKSKEPVSPFARAAFGCPVCNAPLEATRHADWTLDFCAAHGTFFDRGELALVLRHTSLTTRPAVAVGAPVAAASLPQIRTEVLHAIESREDPAFTALMDWVTGGTDWVNRRYR